MTSTANRSSVTARGANHSATDGPTRPGRVLAMTICRIGLLTDAPPRCSRLPVDLGPASDAGTPQRSSPIPTPVPTRHAPAWSAGPPTGRPQEGFFAHQLNPVSARNCSGPLTAAAVAHADDERMVKRAQDGDEAALTGLLIHYRPLVYGRARSYFLVGADHDDLAQEGMLGCAKPSVTSTAGRGVSPPSLRSVSIGRSCLRSGRHPDRSMGR